MLQSFGRSHGNRCPNQHSNAADSILCLEMCPRNIVNFFSGNDWTVKGSGAEANSRQVGLRSPILTLWGVAVTAEVLVLLPAQWQEVTTPHHIVFRRPQLWPFPVRETKLFSYSWHNFFFMPTRHWAFFFLRIGTKPFFFYSSIMLGKYILKDQSLCS